MANKVDYFFKKRKKEKKKKKPDYCPNYQVLSTMNYLNMYKHES